MSHTRPKDISGLIPSAELQKLHRVSSWRGIFHVAFEWSLIVGAAMVCEYFFSWPLYVLVWAFIGGRLLGLGILMHDAVHGLLHPMPKINDVVAEVFCAWPLLISMHSYRQKHLAHHRWVNTDRDPDHVGKTDSDWSFPMPVGKFLRIVLTQLSGLGVFESFRVMSNATMNEGKVKPPRWYTPSRIAFYLLVVATFIALGAWKEMLLYWLTPFLTWTQMANRLRRIAEHSAVEGQPRDFQTRTTLHGIFAQVFLVPNNINYHNEHHLLPGIPWYRLSKVHRQLYHHHEARERMHLSHSYTDVFKEVISTKRL